MNSEAQNSRFKRWCDLHDQAGEENDRVLRAEALAVLVESIKAGEVTTLDGAGSPQTRRISAYHRRSELEMTDNWVLSAQNWSCPGCGRSKFQISRTGTGDQILAKSVIHHDHMRDALLFEFHATAASTRAGEQEASGLEWVNRLKDAFAAFDDVLVCEDCNNADAAAAKLVGSPKYFSFSIARIQQFIRVRDHEPHKLDPDRVSSVWAQARPAYERRLSLVAQTAQAAAYGDSQVIERINAGLLADSSWFEPYGPSIAALPLLGSRPEILDADILRWADCQEVVKALRPAKVPSTSELARWRTARAEPPRTLPTDALSQLLSDRYTARLWNELPDQWRCPVCQRGKYQTIYVAKDGRTKFLPRTQVAEGAWAAAPTICNPCEITMLSLLKEVKCRLGRAKISATATVSPAELASIMDPRPHCYHTIRHSAVADLVEEIVHRSKPADQSA